MVDRVKMAEISWRMVEEARDRGAAIFVPMGSTEQHGPHSPQGDYRLTEVIAERVAKNTNDLVSPAIPFSYSEYFRHFPGTITLGAETLRLLIRDVLNSILDHGFEHVILFNGHKGNEPVVKTVVREIRRERGLLVPYVEPSTFGISKDLIKELYGDEPMGHGGEGMGSKILYVFPDLVDLSRAEDFGRLEFRGRKPLGADSLDFNGNAVGMALNFEDIAPPSGSLSDPRLASAERGERLVETSVAALTEFATWFKSIDPHVTP